MRILGIDPGLRITGYGLVHLPAGSMDPQLVEAGTLAFKPRDPTPQRLNELHQSLTELLEEHRPDCLAVEKLYAHYKHPRTAILMAHARGVILLAAAQAGVPVRDEPATEVKKSLTGNGHASKEQVAGAVAAQCRLAKPPSPPDVADAIAIALCAARRVAYDRLDQRAV